MLHLKDRTYLMVCTHRPYRPQPLNCRKRQKSPQRRSRPATPHRRRCHTPQALSLNLYIDSGPADGVAGPLSLGRYLNDHPDPARINVRFEKARRRSAAFRFAALRRHWWAKRLRPTPAPIQMPSRSKALCVTTKAVEAGEELYVSYGEARATGAEWTGRTRLSPRWKKPPQTATATICGVLLSAEVLGKAGRHSREGGLCAAASNSAAMW